MEVILSQRCKSLTGSIDVGMGYFIAKRGGRFYSVRSAHSVPPDGHWRFIVSCAELAKQGFMLTDIKVPRDELGKALREARIPYLNILLAPPKKVFNASDVLLLKERIVL